MKFIAYAIILIQHAFIVVCDQHVCDPNKCFFECCAKDGLCSKSFYGLDCEYSLD